MSPLTASRRRAEEFASLLDGAATTRRTDPALTDLVELVGSLRAVDVPQARPEFVSDLRARLLTEAAALAEERAAAGDPVEKLRLPPRRTSRRERRVAVALGGLAIVGATTTMAVAAQSALPGDALYPLKRGIESLHADTTFSDTGKGRVLLGNATDRLDEVDRLTSGGDATQVAPTLDAFTAQATEASDLLLDDYATTGNDASITALRDFTGSSMDRLAALEPQVPASARDALRHAALVVDQIDETARHACPECSGTGVGQVPDFLSGAAAGYYVTPVPSATGAGLPSDTGGGHPAASTSGTPDLPDVKPGQLPPGSVTVPDGTPSPVPPDSTTTTVTAPDGTPVSTDPIKDLTAGLTGGSGPVGSVKGALNQVLGDAGDTLGQTVDQATGTVDGAVDDATSGLPKLP